MIHQSHAGGWTEERVNRLKQLWQEGLSASQIAGRLGQGCTRNAVIGKVNRLKLSGRRLYTRRNDPPPIARQRRPKQPRANKPVRNDRVTIRPEPAAVPLRFTAGVWDPLPGSTPLPLAELPAGACKWSVGNPLAPASETRFCACPAHEGGPYCPEHASRAVGRLEA